MSTDINLLLEFRDNNGWRPAFHAADRVKDPRTRTGVLNVCWWSVRSRPTSLFFGDHAVIPFNPGLPGDISPPVYDHVRANFECDATYAAWIPLPELDLASWHRRTVIVGGPVPARYARLFDDGNQPPPIAQLKSLGIADPVLERVTDWRNDRRLVACDVRAHDIQHLSSDCLVDVTWIETLPEFVGWIWDEGLSGLVGIESSDRYRIITSVG
jgi:hypothetical protein